MSTAASTGFFFVAAAVLVATPLTIGPSHEAEPQHQQAATETDWRDVILQEGCALRGREVFFDRRRARCAGCHSVGDDQGLPGPNLWTVGAKYDKRGLLDAILQPSAEVAPQYHVHIFDTATSGLVVGIISDETDEEIVVQNEGGDVVRLERADVMDTRKSDLSMMPDDIVQAVTVRELVDLLEFLTTLRPEDSGV